MPLGGTRGTVMKSARLRLAWLQQQGDSISGDLSFLNVQNYGG